MGILIVIRDTVIYYNYYFVIYYLFCLIISVIVYSSNLVENSSETKINENDVKDRLLFRSVIETLKCYQEGVLRSVADANIGSILGIGAPAWTGGYIQFVNSYGLEKFIIRCNELSEKYGERFNAPSIVVEKLSKNKLFK